MEKDDSPLKTGDLVEIKFGNNGDWVSGTIGVIVQPAVVGGVAGFEGALVYWQGQYQYFTTPELKIIRY